MILEYKITEEDNGALIKNILRNRMQVSRRLITRLKTTDGILLDGVPVFVNVSVKTGNTLRLELADDTLSDNIEPQNMDLSIIYEDECLIAINKPSNLVVHPTNLHPYNTLANGVNYYFLQRGLKTKIRPVSRLDRNTSGVVVFAKNDYVQDYLVRQMKNKNFEKIYYGVTYGVWSSKEGTIDLPIARKPGSIMIRHVSPEGDSAVTHYKVLNSNTDYSLVEFKLETGRTHQIRVHCQALGHALIGDDLYPQLIDKQDFHHIKTIKRQALHSIKSSFPHPTTGNLLILEAPLAIDIVNLLSDLNL